MSMPTTSGTSPGSTTQTPQKRGIVLMVVVYSPVQAMAVSNCTVSRYTPASMARFGNGRQGAVLEYYHSGAMWESFTPEHNSMKLTFTPMVADWAHLHCVCSSFRRL
ncbi:hypothetical protein F4823DRAFT_124295 [Ustulina deusta]|nr:hypothetical protein F4823DRAFT_124295 [Ustulina deusta]